MTRERKPKKPPLPVTYELLELIPILKVTRRTLYNYLKSGELKAHKIGKTWRVTHEALSAFMSGETIHEDAKNTPKKEDE